MEYAMAEVSENIATKIIHAAKKGLTAEVLRLLRKDEAICTVARDKVEINESLKHVNLPCISMKF